MLAKMKVALAAVLVVASASVALAGDPRPPASVRGSPAILFEDRGAGLEPLESCMTDDGFGGRRSCGARGVF